MSTVIKRERAFTKHVHEGQLQTYDDILAAARDEVPAYLREDGPHVGPTEVPVRWYLDPEIHALEVERIWKRTWQFACREEDIPEVGDTTIYKVANLSFIIVRTAPDQIKGYWNACLHRGATLVEFPCRLDKLQCRFHGFTWGLDGKCKLVPYPEDFPQIDKDNFALPEVQVATWEGCVFINPDLDAEPLSSFLGEAAHELERNALLGKRRKFLHFSKRFSVNWKAGQEAFLEALHTLTAHPQIAIMQSDATTRYSTSGNWSRGILPFGQTSPYVPETPTEQQIWNRHNGIWEDDEDPHPELELPEGITARQKLIEDMRVRMASSFGSLVDDFADIEVADILWYTLFPNFSPFAGARTGGMLYRFRPYGDDPEQSIMDVLILVPASRAPEPPPGPEPIATAAGEDFTAVPGIEQFGSSNLGAFLSQDIAIMEGVPHGLKNNQLGYVHFGAHHESKIRHFYAVYEKGLGLSAADEVAALQAGKRKERS